MRNWIRGLTLFALIASVASCGVTQPETISPAPHGTYRVTGVAPTTALISVTAISGTTAIKSQWAAIGSGALSLQLVTTGTVSGSWLIELSNKPDVVNSGDTSPSDVTAGFQTAAGTALAAAAGSATSQFVQTTFLKAGAIRVTFTPSSGAGNAAAYGSLP